MFLLCEWPVLGHLRGFINLFLWVELKGIHYWGLLTFREASCLTKLMLTSEVGMEGSKLTGMVQNWCVFSPSLCYSGQVESERHGGCKITLPVWSTLTNSSLGDAFYTTRWRNCIGKITSAAAEALQNESLMTRLEMRWFLWELKWDNKSQRPKPGFKTQGSAFQVVMTVALLSLD